MTVGVDAPASAPGFEAGVAGILASVMAVNIGTRGKKECCQEGDSRPTDPFGNAGLDEVGSPGELVDEFGSGTCAAFVDVPPIGLFRGDLGLTGPNVVGGVDTRGDRSNLDLSTRS